MSNMSQSGAVYQPTTVTYESNNSPQDRWSERPISYLAATVSQAARRPCGIPCVPARNLLPIVLLISGITCFTIGFAMLLNGAVGYSTPESSEENYYLIVTILGAIFFFASIILLGIFLKLTRRLCFRNGKDHLDTSGGQSLTVNPSTDLLVAAQYAPVSEVAYQPPQEDTEQSKLMPQENNKDLNNEDTDRMVESDPRIVLRPLNPPTHEET